VSLKPHVALALTLLLPLFSSPVYGQQSSPEPGPGSTAAAPTDQCEQFNKLLGSIDGTSGAVSPEQVEKKFGRLADAAKAGEACAKTITESFRNLRGKSGASPSWSQIERELDRIIDAQRSFIDKIEGSGGLIEEATRSESVIQQRIEEAQRNYPDQAEKEKDRLQRLKATSSATATQKDALAKAIRDIQAAKPRIAFAEGGKQFDATVNALDRFNKALEDFTAKMPKSPSGDPGM